jgi:hypothetical protein
MPNSKKPPDSDSSPKENITQPTEADEPSPPPKLSKVFSLDELAMLEIKRLLKVALPEELWCLALYNLKESMITKNPTRPQEVLEQFIKDLGVMGVTERTIEIYLSYMIQIAMDEK